MELLHWLQGNWLDLFQTAAIVGGYIAYRRDKRKEQVQNWIHFTERHAELSRQQTYDPKLARLTQRKINLLKAPVTVFEEDHVRERIHLLSAVHYATKNGFLIAPSALPYDIRSYFGLPIQKEVWERAKKFHEPDFVRFVKAHLGVTL